MSVADTLASWPDAVPRRTPGHTSNRGWLRDRVRYMTPNWDVLLDEASFVSILPGDYARFARPIRDAMILFLAGLPQSQQASMVAVQASLPADTSFSARFGILARSSPVLQKLGQILARDRRLPLELRQHLHELESLSPTGFGGRETTPQSE